MPEKTPVGEHVVDEGVEGGKLKIFMDFYFWFVAHLVELYISIAESLGLREPALESLDKRVRWTCVCGCRLYDDFEELSPGAVQVLQRHLDNSDPQLDRSIRSTEPSDPHDFNSDPKPDRFERAEDPEIDSVRREQTESIYDKLRNRDLGILRRKPTQAQTLWLVPFTCFIGDRWEEFPISAFDIYDRKNPPDTELFMQIKQRYFESKGRFSRFLSPQWAKGIRDALVRSLQVTFICMRLMSSTQYLYPAGTMPTIGPNYLMHLWQNPHHTNWLTYQKNKSVLDTARWVMRKLLDLARTGNPCAGRLSGSPDETLAGHQSSLSDTEQHLFRQSYVFHTIPKELGVKPDYKHGDDAALILMEKFQLRYLVVLIALILQLTVYALVMGVYFRYLAGLQGLGLYLRLFWISSWISGLSTLIITLWLKSSDYPCLEFVWRFCQEQFGEYLETMR
ncbi:hypothetical protein JMJ35_000346 [Cladonia borealis]|uniref:Uncharacterized protein n=1 Tax=Cladonia borealis TaxID=184061 RepID=A0AA39RB80_9LECA|nr:hypothetical protein JMJ35_000346 [Cladonia borealis]